AAREGASRRFRGVMMTAESFIIGVLRLLGATWAGADCRRPMGTKGVIRLLVGSRVGVGFTYKNHTQHTQDSLSRTTGAPDP
ncbi:efflux RND transporter permease subunit, partial [Enterobacter hormaechei]